MLSSASQLTIATTSIIFITLWSLYARRSNFKGGCILPPGPTGFPLLGNVLQVPSKVCLSFITSRHLATYFRTLVEHYGGLVSLNLAGSTVVLIGDMEVAKTLLEKHSAKHSSRPSLHYWRNYVDPTNDMWGMSEEHHEEHLIGRKLTNNIMSVVRAGKTEPLQEFEAVLNVQHLLDDGGKNWFHHIERVASSTTLTAAFGLHCPTGHEPESRELFAILAEIVHLANPTASITNFLPFLDLIPGPMPWRIRARLYRERHDALYEKLIDHAMRCSAAGMDTWAATFVGENKPYGDQRRLVKQFAGAAIETTMTALQTFVLACIRYPEWIATAQKEIDNLIGPDRLPSFRDRPFLPYIEAVVRARYGIPHLSTADDTIEHNGQAYFIPKGSLIFAVTFAIEHDRSKFEDHDRFMPERFLDSEGRLKTDYETSAFGFGRRVCPGIPFAERSLWIDIVTMLWTFSIRASDQVDPMTGLPFQYDDSDAAFHGAVTNSPFKFPAVFEPRSSQRVEVARREWAEYEKDLNVLMPGTTEQV
ncbi:O-methylsterigmatocystin oxidoreductase [Termitomyces sp. J132]|nr:O-methylsterigmatocystin oxidoreductase [Termitomyces sp. J132]